MSIYQKAFINGVGRIFTLPRLSIPLILTLGLTLGAVLSVVAISSALLYQPLIGVKNEQRLKTYHFNFKISDTISASFWNMHRLAHFSQTFKDKGTWAAMNATTDQININNINFAVTYFNGSHTINEVLGTEVLKGQSSDIENPEKYLWISNDLWQQAYGGQEDIIGKTIQHDSQSYLIAGVLENLMAINADDTILPAQIWKITDLNTILATQDDGQISDNYDSLILKTDHPNVTMPTKAQTDQWLINYVTEHMNAPAEFLGFIQRQPKEYLSANYRDQLLGDSQNLLLVLGTAVLGLLIMATLNLLNLFIAHYQSRSKELAIQLTLGASLLRVRLLVLLENLPSFITAAIWGLLVTGWVLKSLPIIADNALPMLELIRIDSLTIIASILVILLLSILFSSLALVDVDKHALANNLNGSGKGVQAQTNQWLSRSLMVLQLSIASILLTGSIMLAKQSYDTVYRDLGFDWDNHYQVTLSIADEQWLAEMAQYEQYFGSEKQQLLHNVGDKLQQLVPNSEVVIHAPAPLTSEFTVGAFKHNNDPNSMVLFMRGRLNPGYFNHFNIPVLAGANLTEQQIINGEPRVLLDRAMAEQLFAGQSYQQIIGQVIPGFGNEDQPVIVNGIVENILPRAGLISNSNPATVYSADLGRGPRVNVILKLPQGQQLAAADIEQALQQAFPRLNNLTVRSIDNMWHEQTFNQQVSLWIVLTMTLLTLLLAAIGVSGLTQMTTFHRKYELAVRMATGAKQLNLLKFILKDALGVLVAGLGLGFVLAVLVYEQLKQQLDLLPSFNWLTISTLDLLLVLIVLASVIWPAWKVISNDPMQALRQE